MLFHPDDDALLDYLQDDGMSIEPMFYVPILPLVLINGSDGIGTGWSSSVPQHNPRDVIANLKRMMAGEEPQLMSPWYRGFNGVIVPDNRGSFITYGTVAKDASDERVLHISELPVRTWTQEYKDKVLEPMLTGVAAADKDKDAKGAKVEQLLDDVREYHTDTKVSFSLRYLSAAPLQEAEAKGQLHKQLKLSSTISMTNLTLFDEQGRIHRHESVASILASFYELRLSYYEKRKLHLAEKLTAEFDKLDNRTRFISAVISGELKISNVKKEVLVATLDKMKYKRFEPVLKKKRAGGEDEDEDEDESAVHVDEKTGAAAAAKASAARGYDYLLSMPLWSLTAEKVEQLRNELRTKETELQALLATSPKQLWTTDLDAFLEAYSTWEAQIAAEEAGGPAPKKGKGGKAKAPATKAATKAKLSEDEEEEDFMEDDDDDDWDAKPKKKAAPPKGSSRAPTPPPPPPSAAMSVVVPVPAAPPPPKRKAPTAAKAGKEEEGSDEDAELDGDDAPVAGPAAAPKRKAPAASKAKKEEAEAAWKPPSSLGDGGDVSDAMDEAGPSPAARPAVKRACSKPSPALALGRAKRATAVTSFAGMDDDEEDDEMGSEDSEDAQFDDEEDSDGDFVEEKPKAKAASKPTAPKAPARAAPKPVPKSKYVEVSDDDVEEDEEDYVPAKKAPSKAALKPAAPKPAPKPKAPPKPKAKKAASDDDDYEDEEEVVPRAASSRPGRAAAAKASQKAKAVLDEDDDDDSEYVGSD
jgi:DNA topoisomerase-2